MSRDRIDELEAQLEVALGLLRELLEIEGPGGLYADFAPIPRARAFVASFESMTGVSNE